MFLNSVDLLNEKKNIVVPPRNESSYNSILFFSGFVVVGAVEVSIGLPPYAAVRLAC